METELKKVKEQVRMDSGLYWIHASNKIPMPDVFVISHVLLDMSTEVVTIMSRTSFISKHTIIASFH